MTPRQRTSNRLGGETFISQRRLTLPRRPPPKHRPWLSSLTPPAHRARGSLDVPMGLTRCLGHRHSRGPMSVELREAECWAEAIGVERRSEVDPTGGLRRRAGSMTETGFSLAVLVAASGRRPLRPPP